MRHAALFGSTARGDRQAGSDIDIDIDGETKLGVYDNVALTDYISALFSEEVDVVNRERLKPQPRSAALDDAVYSFL